MKLDNQTRTKITSKSPPNFDRRKKNQWSQNTNHPDVTNEVVLMEEWTVVNLESVNRQMKRRRPQPQDPPVLKIAQDIIIIMEGFGYSHANQKTDTVCCEAKS